MPGTCRFMSVRLCRSVHAEAVMGWANPLVTCFIVGYANMPCPCNKWPILRSRISDVGIWSWTISGFLSVNRCLFPRSCLSGITGSMALATTIQGRAVTINNAQLGTRSIKGAHGLRGLDLILAHEMHSYK